MNLVVVSHKVCWRIDGLSSYATDGGFPLQMKYLSQLFSSTTLVVPCKGIAAVSGLTEITGNNISVEPLPTPTGHGLRRKVGFVRWLFINSPTIWRQVKQADAVHAPIPGDVGTVGLVFAVLLRKRLFVRHCGNWLKPRTLAEHCWKLGMEKLAGNRNAMLATGGGSIPPSLRNPKLEWIFSTSITEEQLESFSPRTSAPATPRLVIACRQEKEKGTDLVIRSLLRIRTRFPGVTLSVVGDGSQLPRLKALADEQRVGDSVVFHGKVTQSKVLDILCSSDLFCFPTSASEGFPKAVLEALAVGLPVVSTRVSVIPDLLSKGGGALIETLSPDELADTIIEILSDPERYVAMSEKAIKTASSYTLETWRNQIADFLKSSWKAEVAVAEMGKRQSVGRL